MRPSKARMAITHVNRKGKTYYLHVSTTRTGKPKYYFSLASDGALADQLPSGFEVHEEGTGQVSLRRERPRLITDEEVQTVEREMARAALTRGYVDRDREFLIVYVADPGDFEDELRQLFPFSSPSRIDEVVARTLHYQPAFRFVLVDAEKRLFRAQRYCYLGSIDDWIFFGAANRLERLARKYLEHANKDSYYELM